MRIETEVNSYIYSMTTLRVQSVVHNKFASEDLMITQPEFAETMRNPSQPLAGRMRITRVRIGSPYNCSKQVQSQIAQIVFFNDGIKRHVLSMVAQLAIWHIVHGTFPDLRPIRLVGKKDELGFGIDKMFD